MTTSDVLRAVPLFNGMTDNGIEAIASLTTETTFADGETLVRGGGWSGRDVHPPARGIGSCGAG